MPKTELLRLFKKSTIDITDFLSSVPSNKLSVKPSSESWSILEILDHLWVVETLILKGLCNDQVKRLEEGKELFGSSKIKSIMSDVERKIKATEKLQPQYSFSSFEELVEKFLVNRQSVQELADKNFELFSLTHFPHPVMGELTKLEWIYFIMYHSERHFSQMKKVFETIS